MCASREHDVFQLTSLGCQRRIELRMRMAVNVHPPRRNAIEDATGASLTALPFTPEKMLAALDAERIDADRSPT